MVTNIVIIKNWSTKNTRNIPFVLLIWRRGSKTTMANDKDLFLCHLLINMVEIKSRNRRCQLICPVQFIQKAWNLLLPSPISTQWVITFSLFFNFQHNSSEIAHQLQFSADVDRNMVKSTILAADSELQILNTYVCLKTLYSGVPVGVFDHV